MESNWQPESALAKAVWAAGFKYDPDQDIIYSRMNAWQRMTGYAYAYDFAAPFAISALIDCEPIFFIYEGKEWMIELWKGQYGVESGGEIGVYYRNNVRNGSLLDDTIGKRPHDERHSRFYHCVDDEHRLRMSFTLSRNGERLFTRGPEEHWWLTGFRWGVLSEPKDLVMELSIKFPTAKMCRAFGVAAEELGYRDIKREGDSCGLRFEDPKSHQPRRDVPVTILDRVGDRNRELVDSYNRLGLSKNDPNTIPQELAENLEKYFDARRAPSGKASDYRMFWGSWRGLDAAKFHVHQRESVSFVVDLPDRHVKGAGRALISLTQTQAELRFSETGQPVGKLSCQLAIPPFALEKPISVEVERDQIALVDRQVVYFGSDEDRQRHRNWIQGSAFLRNGEDIACSGKVNVYVGDRTAGIYDLKDIAAVVDVTLNTTRKHLEFRGAVQWLWNNKKYCTGIESTVVEDESVPDAVRKEVDRTMKAMMKKVSWPTEPCPSLKPPV